MRDIDLLESVDEAVQGCRCRWRDGGVVRTVVLTGFPGRRPAAHLDDGGPR